LLRRFCYLSLLFLTVFFGSFDVIHSDQIPSQQIESQSAFPTKDPITIQLIGEEETIQPGHPFLLAIHLKMDEPWHAYWKNPGDAGFPLSVEWHLPEGFTAGDLEWPFPKRFVMEPSVSYGYDSEAMLLVPITPPDNLATNTTSEISATITWLVCSESGCYPGKTDVKISFNTKDETPKINSAWEAQFTNAKASLPKFSQDEWTVEGRKNNDKIDLILTVQNGKKTQWTSAFFAAEEQDLIDHTDLGVLTKMGENPDQYIMSLKPLAIEQILKTKQIKGVFVAYNENDPKRPEALDIDLVKKSSSGKEITFSQNLKNQKDIESIAPLEHVNESSDNSSNETTAPQVSHLEWEGGIGWALLFAFIGGMILNLMPCVLPVISFKVLSFVKMSGQSRKETFKHGMAFFVGVLISFWTLAGLLLILQSYGRVVGWGFQLQEPLFVAVLAAVLVVFSMSLFGVFEIGTFFASWAGQIESDSTTKARKSSEKSSEESSSGLTGSFFSGVLATAVATPCTGPFLGSALGFALTLSPFFALLIFTSLGVGMALPYIILAIFPSLLRFLPKPGPWMVTFKEVMGFLLLATVAWLIWVFGAQTDHMAIFLLLLGFLSLTFGCWVYGRWGSFLRKRSTRLISQIVAVMFFVMGGYAIFTAATGDYVQEEQIVKGDWEPFSAERIKTIEILNKNRRFAQLNKGSGSETASYLSPSDIEFVESHLLSTVSSQTSNLEKNLYVLSTVVSLAPFLGLLGTVWGILTTFSELQSLSTGSTHQMVLGGLSLALATTVMGLLDAIPALIGYNYLKNGIKDFQTEMECFSNEILTSVELQYRKVDVS